jgi:hypothetical protein
MNEDARRLLVNIIVYMKRFDGARQTVWRGVQNRDLLRTIFNYDNPEAFRQMVECGNLFSPSTVSRLGFDLEKYKALYTPNLGYVFVPHGASWLEIVEDAKSIGVTNNDVRFLEKCVELLNRPSEAAKARRLLERYTRLSLPGPKAWRRWLEKNRDKLYFSDGFDYRFFVGPAGPAPSGDSELIATEGMKQDMPNQAAPVTVGSTAVGYVLEREDDGYYTTKKGAILTLIVRLRIAEGWRAYALSPHGKRYETTKVDFELPAGARWHGEWRTPPNTPGFLPGAREYRGDVIFSRQLYFTTVPVEGRPEWRTDWNLMRLRGNVRFQACDARHCLPPTDVHLEVSIGVEDR